MSRNKQRLAFRESALHYQGHTHTSQEKNTDSEVYSTRACLKARSCKIALVASIIVLLLVLAALILLLGEWTGS